MTTTATAPDRALPGKVRKHLLARLTLLAFPAQRYTLEKAVRDEDWPTVFTWAFSDVMHMQRPRILQALGEAVATVPRRTALLEAFLQRLELVRIYSSVSGHLSLMGKLVHSSRALVQGEVDAVLQCAIQSDVSGVSSVLLRNGYLPSERCLTHCLEDARGLPALLRILERIALETNAQRARQALYDMREEPRPTLTARHVPVL
jgi:hypothetical protein